MLRSRCPRCLVVLGATLVLTGCADLVHTLSWKSDIFVRIPGQTPPGYVDTDPEHNTFHTPDYKWYFRHVVTCSASNGKEDANWWLVTCPGNPDYLKLGRASGIKMLTTGSAILDSDWHKVAALTPAIARASFQTFGAYPQMVEPDLVFNDAAAEKEIKADAYAQGQNAQKRARHASSADTQLQLYSLHEGGWSRGPTEKPPFDPLWHFSDRYSQLDRAKSMVRAKTGSAGGGIRVGILDTGYSSSHLLVPTNTLDSRPGAGDHRGEHWGDAMSVLYRATKRDTPEVRQSEEKKTLFKQAADICPGDANGTHGMKAMSVLAGPKRVLNADKFPGKVCPNRVGPDHPIEIGGVPDAVIVPARVAPWVYSHSTANLAYAIDYASRVQHCDVISMSHGGTPSPMWIDAVNAAYDRGTAIFAACGDYFDLPPIPLGIVVPSTAVYPASCRRVLSVTGVTGNGEPYGRTDLRHHGWYYLNPLHWFVMHGSFGGDGVYRGVFHTSLRGMVAHTDEPEVSAGGLLRAWPIATYVPNIASAEPCTKDNHFTANRCNMDWGGTSAATPQAAAAAALWLAYHKDDIQKLDRQASKEKGKGKEQIWTTWRKAEAAYIAMLKTAAPTTPGGRQYGYDNRAKGPRWVPYPDKYTGTGALKAADMLKIDYENARRTNQPGLNFPTRPNGMDKDFYDGQRSGAAILGLVSPHFPDYQNRADAALLPKPPITGQAALKVIYTNQMLAHQWNIGHVPLSKYPYGKPHNCENARTGRPWPISLFWPNETNIIDKANAMAAQSKEKKQAAVLPPSCPQGKRNSPGSPTRAQSAEAAAPRSPAH